MLLLPLLPPPTRVGSLPLVSVAVAAAAVTSASAAVDVGAGVATAARLPCRFFDNMVGILFTYTLTLTPT